MEQLGLVPVHTWLQFILKWYGRPTERAVMSLSGDDLASCAALNEAAPPFHEVWLSRVRHGFVSGLSREQEGPGALRRRVKKAGKATWMLWGTSPVCLYGNTLSPNHQTPDLAYAQVVYLLFFRPVGAGH